MIDELFVLQYIYGYNDDGDGIRKYQFSKENINYNLINIKSYINKCFISCGCECRFKTIYII